jgi:hypothetical protein
LHIHVIPRLMSLDPLLRETLPSGTTTIRAWDVPRLTPEARIPVHYSPAEPEWADRVTGVIGSVRSEFAKSS